MARPHTLLHGAPPPRAATSCRAARGSVYATADARATPFVPSGFRPSPVSSLALSPLKRPAVALAPSHHVQAAAERERRDLQQSVSSPELAKARPLRPPVLLPDLARKAGTPLGSPPAERAKTSAASCRLERTSPISHSSSAISHSSCGARVRAAERAQMREQLCSVASSWAKGAAERAFSMQVAEVFAEMFVPPTG